MEQPGQLKIPKFNSTGEFRAWWSSVPVQQFCRDYPSKITQLKEHPSVKPWLTTPAKPLAKPATDSKMFGKYQIEKKLGEGGMGMVYLANDPTLNRKVALKIMVLKEASAIERFMREARSAAKLKHPNIVQIYEVGTEGKYHYFTMEYIEGKGLDDLIDNKAVTSKRAAEIIRDIALALDYAHRSGIIHRDLKPANIIVTPDNQAYLMDFGLAKETTGLEKALTLNGTIMGTPEYMSPEQARGDMKNVDARSDIFSLGAAFYHALTGQRPFLGKELYQILERVTSQEAIPPRRLARSLPRDLETICLKCLEKLPEQRYQTAQDLADDLTRYLAGQTIIAQPAGFTTRILRKAIQNKTASLAISGFLVVFIVVGIVTLSSSADLKQRIERHRTEAKSFYDKDDYEQALMACKQLLGLAPDDPGGAELLAACQKRINAQAEAAQEKKASEIAAYRRQVERMMAQHNLEEVRLAANKILGIAPDDAQAKKWLAYCEEERAKREKARAILNRVMSVTSPDDKIAAASDAVKIDPTFAEAYQVMGLAYRDKADNDRAFECFSQAIERDPKLTYAYYERGCITYDVRRKPAEAVGDFNKVIELDPASPIGLFSKGMVECERKNYDVAIKNLNAAISNKPDFADAYICRGLCFYSKSDTTRAIADYTKAINLNPKRSDVYNNLAIIYAEIDNYQKALEIFTLWIEQGGGDRVPDAYINRANCYSHQGNDNKAIGDYNRALVLAPDNPEIYLRRSYTYAKVNNLRKAIADGEKFLQLAPTDARVDEMRGYLAQWKQELNKQGK